METKIVEKTSRKNGTKTYIYYVDGKLVRTSKKIYCASTCDGGIFWGRPDLVGKGEYIKRQDFIKFAEQRTFADMQKEALNRVQHYQDTYNFYRSEDGLNECRKMVRLFQKGPFTPEQEEEFEAKAQKDFKQWQENTFQWLQEAKQNAEPEAVQKEFDAYKKRAADSKKGMKIVYYDTKNIEKA